MNQPKAVFRGMIVLYFVIGFEILIMISPAAGFFYASFNPFLLSLAQSPATRWLTASFLPPMVSPPDLLLTGMFVPRATEAARSLYSGWSRVVKISRWSIG